MEKYQVGVIGGTGMVGQRFITLLEHHPWFELKDIRRPAVGGIVGDHGALVSGVALLQTLNILFFHIHGGKDKIHLIGNLRHILLGV